MIIECSAGRQGVLETDYASARECRQLNFWVSRWRVAVRAVGHGKTALEHKARLLGLRIHALADGSGVDWSTAGDKIVPVDIFDEGDVKVFTAKITMNVKIA